MLSAATISSSSSDEPHRDHAHDAGTFADFGTPLRPAGIGGDVSGDDQGVAVQGIQAGAATEPVLGAVGGEGGVVGRRDGRVGLALAAGDAGEVRAGDGLDGDVGDGFQRAGGALLGGDVTAQDGVELEQFADRKFGTGHERLVGMATP